MTNNQKALLGYVVGGVIGLIPRVAMKKKGMIKSIWFGLPHKPGTFK